MELKKHRVKPWQDIKVWSTHAEFFHTLSSLYRAQYAHSVSILGIIYQELGNNSKALQYCRLAIGMSKHIYGEEAHRDVAIFLNNLGEVLYFQHKYTDAERCYHQALTICEKVHEEQHPIVIALYNNMGLSLQKQANYELAIVYHKKAFQTAKKVNEGKVYCVVADSLDNIGLACDRLRRYDDALKHYRIALAMRKSISGDKAHPHIATSLHNIGVVLERKGQSEQALDYYSQALIMRKEIYRGESHSDLLCSLHAIESILDQLGRSKQALSYKQEASEENVRNQKQELAKKYHVYATEVHPDVAKCLYKTGCALEQQEKYDEALDYHYKALEMRQKIHGAKGHWDIVESFQHIQNLKTSEKN